MKQRRKLRKKIAHILDELTTYLLDLEANRIVNEIVEFEDKTVMTCMAKVTLADEEVEKLKEALEAHHDCEYDEYWRLVGEHAHGEELTLISCLVDKGEVNYSDGVLTLTIERMK